MSSLAEAIAKVADPTPKVLDPEDDINTETDSKVYRYDEDNQPAYEISELRSKTAPLLEDVDPKYVGRKVSRKSLEDIFHKDIKFSNDDKDTYSNISDLSSATECSDSMLDENVHDEDLSDGDLSSFKKLVQIQSAQGSVNSDEDPESDEEESCDSDEEKVNEDDTVQPFSNVDVESEIEKGKALKSQLEIWNRLCESRIKLQKLLILVNKLPQPDSWQSLKDKGGKQMSEILNEGFSSVKVLFNNCLDLQTELLKRNPEISSLDSGNAQIENKSEEVPSNTDEEMEPMEENASPEKETVKRKLKNNDYDEILAKRYKSLMPYRNTVIQKWDEKTRLSTGRMAQKSFMAFDNSAIKQIEQILQDKNRLIKRTQLKRSLYRVLGQPEYSEMSSEENPEGTKSKQDMLLRDYDPEIFDDADFYRQMLKDVIESKSVGIDRAVVRKQMEIQKIRNKMKKKVDTKASKGRKLRYDVHPKLVNCMAPVQISKISDEARENLLRCLFGRSYSKS